MDEPSEAACEAARETCSPSATIEPQADAACEMSSQVLEGDIGCEADFDCTQAADADGRAIVAKGRMLVRCARDAISEPWSCSCASDQQTARFALGEPDLDSSQACSEARVACLDHIPLHLGAYGSSSPPPNRGCRKLAAMAGFTHNGPATGRFLVGLSPPSSSAGAQFPWLRQHMDLTGGALEAS